MTSSSAVKRELEIHGVYTAMRCVLTDDIVRFNIEGEHSLCACELVDYGRWGLEWELFHAPR